MKYLLYWPVLVLLAALTLTSSDSPAAAATAAKPTANGSIAKPAPQTQLDPAFAAFVAARRRQAEALDRELKLNTPPILWNFFDAAAAGDWKTTTNLYATLRELPSEVAAPVNETRGAMEAFTTWDNRLLHRFGDEIVRGIPPGSIYLSGTEAGRFIVAALCKSDEGGDPFFIVSKNALINGLYLNSLSRSYANKIYIPIPDDAQRAFNEYRADAQRRLEHDGKFPHEPKQLKLGENVPGVDDREQVSDAVAVTAISGRLAQLIFEKNPQREFYVEESSPIDWMLPHLSPHGLILKINRQPLAELSDETVQRDREVWNRQTAQLVGHWLTNDTSIQEICAFAERVHLRKNLDGFTGDGSFLRDPYAPSAFAKLRCVIASVYQWRATKSANAAQPQRYSREAELAFKQALALSPTSPDTVSRFVNFLITQDRVDDALQIAGTAQILEPSNPRFDGLLRDLGRIQQGQRNKPRPEEELALLQEQFSASPTNLQTALQLVQVYLQLHQTNGLVATVESVLLHTLERKAELYWAAQIYSQIGYFQRLETLSHKLLKLDPTDPDAWYELAAAQIQQGKHPEGQQSLSMAMRLGAMRQGQDPSAPDLRLKSRQDPRFSTVMKKSILD